MRRCYLCCNLPLPCVLLVLTLWILYNSSSSSSSVSPAKCSTPDDVNTPRIKRTPPCSVLLLHRQRFTVGRLTLIVHSPLLLLLAVLLASSTVVSVSLRPPYATPATKVCTTTNSRHHLAHPHCHPCSFPHPNSPTSKVICNACFLQHRTDNLMACQPAAIKKRDDKKHYTSPAKRAKSSK